MGHPNGKVARASHSMFSAFISSAKESDEDERVSLKEQLVFYYIQRSLMVSNANKDHNGRIDLQQLNLPESKSLSLNAGIS